MKKNLLHRIFAMLSATVLCVGTAAMFSGCTTDNPEITITYAFQGTESEAKEFKVDYILSRKAAPQTVMHFIELATANYFDGLCIHDYQSNKLFSGGYTYENGELEEKNYQEAVKSLTLTQSVFERQADGSHKGINTVCGEFNANAEYSNPYALKHAKGALVMYYSDKGNCSERIDAVHNGKMYDHHEYKYNSATSLFYTFTGTSSSSDDKNYAVFGKTKDYDQLQALLDAINDYVDTLADETDFTDEKIEFPNQHDYFQSVRDDKVSATYNVPTMPITVRSIVVNKF